MKKIDISKSFVYKWRYQIGYALLAIVFAVLIFAVPFFSSNGLSTEEMSSAADSFHLSFNDLFTENIINLPYKLLQKASISIFGLSIFSVKLPSLVLAFFSGLGIIILLNRWFKSNVAVLSSGLILTTGMFLFAANSGTANILYIFWPVVILILGSLIINEKRINPFVTIFLFMALGLSVFTPFMIYLLITIVIATIIHPHLRFTVRSIPIIQLSLGITIFLAVISPLAISFFTRPVNGLTLLTGGSLEGLNVLENIKMAFMPFAPFSTSEQGSILTPIIGLPTIALIVLGIVSLFKDRHSAKNYILTIWVSFAVLISVLDSQAIYIALVPIAVTIASGLELVLNSWYGIFPENPYARVAGLIPVSFLLFAMITSSINHFIFGHKYSPEVARSYNTDVSLIKDHLQDSSVILANENSVELRFYKALEGNNITVTSEAPVFVYSNLIVLNEVARDSLSKNLNLETIVTSDKSVDADRLYIYKNSSD